VEDKYLRDNDGFGPIEEREMENEDD